MFVSWFSAGVSSFVATYLLREELDHILYCHIDEQHEDSIRFLRECEKALGKKIEILQSPYKSVENVINTFQFVNSRYGAKCTDVLKRRVRKEWEHGKKNLTYVWGYDLEEKHRADRIEEIESEYKHRFPLIERGLKKSDCHGILRDLGIARPKMYRLGYPNNNCVGCVKGGMGYWNKIRKDFPETFKKRAMQEREIGKTCLTEVINGETKQLYLDELDPNRGRMNKEIMEECGFLCQLAFNEEVE